MKLIINEETTTMVLTPMEDNEEIEENNIEQFTKTLNYLKQFFMY
jgi:hypothetical protein